MLEYEDELIAEENAGRGLDFQHFA